MIQRKHISLGLHFSGNIHVNNRPSTDLNKVLQRNGRVKVKEDEFIPSSENMKKKEIREIIRLIMRICGANIEHESIMNASAYVNKPGKDDNGIQLTLTACPSTSSSVSNGPCAQNSSLQSSFVATLQNQNKVSHGCYFT